MSNKPIGEVLVFSASWCGPCRQMKPLWRDPDVLKVLEEEKLKLVEIDIDNDENSAKIHRISSIPTVILMRDGKEINRNVGAMNKSQLINFLRSAG